MFCGEPRKISNLLLILILAWKKQKQKKKRYWQPRRNKTFHRKGGLWHTASWSMHAGGGRVVPGHPTIWITVGQGPTALVEGVGCLDIFILIYPFSPLSPSLYETAWYRVKYCLKGPLNPKQPTNQPTMHAWLKKDATWVFTSIKNLFSWCKWLVATGYTFRVQHFCYFHTCIPTNWGSTL